MRFFAAAAITKFFSSPIDVCHVNAEQTSEDKDTIRSAMKLPLNLLIFPVVASHVTAFSTWSAFGGRRMSTMTRLSFQKQKNDLLMYDSSRDPPNKEGNNGNMWAVLANTERWLSDTLSSQNGQNNPYTRKEVSYVCDTSDDGAMIAAGIFRRLREAREQGELHGQAEEERLAEKGKVFSPRTLRQTQVIVIPSNDEYQSSFHKFDALVESINQARRNARDYVTEVLLEKLDERMHGESERDWSVSVNCAHLHPKFGELSMNEKLQEMKEEEEAGEVDLNLQAYKEKRLLARRSPYPTIVVEVRSTPPPDFSPKAKKATRQPPPEENVTSDDIQKLEALFGRSATFDHPTKSKSPKEEENDFYNAIGRASGIDEISLVTPMILAQNWIAAHARDMEPSCCTFTATEIKHVDEGYEFVFTNLAMHISQFGGKPGMRQYLVMSNFLPSSATSFEKFANEANSISKCIPGLSGKLKVSTLHPEHVDPTKRSPVPVLVWTWV